MAKIHVKDDFLDKIKEYENAKEVEILKVVESKTYDIEEETRTLLHYCKLENGVEITYYLNGFDIYTDENCIVYAPAYDVEKSEMEDYSMYEPEDLLGYVNMGYDYRNYLGED